MILIGIITLRRKNHLCVEGDQDLGRGNIKDRILHGKRTDLTQTIEDIKLSIEGRGLPLRQRVEVEVMEEVEVEQEDGL
jgi:hypothetical protein